MSRSPFRPDAAPTSRPARHRAFGAARRGLLRFGLAAGAMAALGGMAGQMLAARLLAPAALGPAVDADLSWCRTAADGIGPAGPLRPFKLAWTTPGICTAAGPCSGPPPTAGASPDQSMRTS